MIAVHAVSAGVESLENTGEKHELAEIEEDLGELDDAQKAKNAMWKNFKLLTDTYQAENKRLLEQNIAISRDLDDSRLGVKLSSPIRYNSIPNFNFLTASVPLGQGTSVQGCQVACNQQPSCKSFSWNKKTNQCRTATATLHYSPHATMYLKKEEGEGDPADLYQAIPGFVGDVTASGATPKMSFVECQHTCTEAETDCKAFVYYEETRQCASVGSGAAFSKEWEFYEKVTQYKDESEVQHVKKENAFKKKLLAIWQKQNKKQMESEGVIKKELKEKCQYKKTLVDQVAVKKEVFHKSLLHTQKLVTEVKAKIVKQRNGEQRANEKYLRYKTRALKATLKKELKTKESIKISDPKRIREVYVELDDLRDEIETNSHERDENLKELNKQKEQGAALEQEKAELEKNSEEADQQYKVHDAKHLLAHAEHHAKCESQATTTLKEKLEQAVADNAQARFVAVNAEMRAEDLRGASERANKALVARKDANQNIEDVQKQAIDAGDAADAATTAAKAATKAELVTATKKDKLKMDVEKAVAAQNILNSKVKSAKTFLLALEHAKKEEDEAQEEAESAASEP
jgi:hypothetical protein